MKKHDILTFTTLTIFINPSACELYRQLTDWRWEDFSEINRPRIFPSIYEINNRSPHYGRSDEVNHKEWKWSDGGDDDRDVVFHMKKKLKKNSRISDKSSNKVIKPYVPFNSLTFNKIKDDSEATIETSSKAPWWMAFTKVTDTTTISTTETYSTTKLTTPEKTNDALSIPVNFNTVKFEPVPSLTVGDIASKPQLQQPHSSNTIGKLINVTEGDVPTKMMHGLIVPVTTRGRNQTIPMAHVPVPGSLSFEESKENDNDSKWEQNYLENKHDDQTTVMSTFTWQEIQTTKTVGKWSKNKPTTPTTTSAGRWSTNSVTTASTTRKEAYNATEEEVSTVKSTTKFDWMQWLASRSKLETTNKPTTKNFDSSTISNGIKTENDSEPETSINDDRISTTEKVKSVTNLNTKTTNNDFPLWTWWNPSKSNNTSTDNLDTPNTDAATDSPSSIWENDQKMKNDVKTVINNNSIEEVTDSDFTESVSYRDDRNNKGTQLKHNENFKHEEDVEELNLSSKIFSYDHDQKTDKESLRDKYIELMNHNTKLVDILKKTLEMQAEMFRKLIRYLFP